MFNTLDGLKSKESLVLINDHDPKPLLYQLDAERKGLFEWKYLAQGPEEWKVEISRK
ncbi:MAG: DUF2249 domain-containing protein [Planctomycetes bacterium]|nr:DUF2249 domain-containing protein [Planctomycetota bacterium]